MIVFGHRGARGEAPENTLPGFTYARQAGVAAFELDVRLSADDQLVVIHDATVDRTTTATGPVAGFTAAELAALDARAAFPEWPTPAGVPRLADVLDAYAGTMRFAIEIKTDEPGRLERVGGLLAAAIGRYGLLGRVAVSSFDPLALEIVRRLAPDVPLGRGSAEIVKEAQANGLRVVGWLGNTPEDLERLLAWGVDGITSDYPSRALAFLGQRGIATDAW